jgi:valyl-tRNA synthetase
MDKNYDHTKESEIYDLWEKSGSFKASKTGKPYTILMPPPNANASLHAGHAMYTVDDVLIRFKRMQGYSALWIPGIDHAGFETQFVYEKSLAKEGKSRMDFDRQTLYKNIFEFVKANSGLIFEQFKRLGFSADWDRSVAAWDKNVVDYVYQTFKKMEKESLVYRDNYIVNYCTHCGTSLAELEVKHLERKDPLYYIKYGPFVLATVRPETKFGDTAVAVHPKDKRYKVWVGKEIEVEGLLGKFKLRVIADDFVDPEFGTGVVKVTPAHDPNDFEMGKRHNLETKQIIDLNGRLTDLAGTYAGLKVKAAREKVVEDLKKKGLIEKIDEEYLHSVTVCYKCGHDLEPTIMPNWFIKVDSLKQKVIKAVVNDEVKFFPGKYKKHMLSWLEIMHDWPISRQIVWCIRIPVWYRIDPSASNIWVWWLDKNNKLQQGNVSQFINKGVSIKDIESGLQKVYALTGKGQPEYVVSDKKPNDGNLYLPETDTFDTWFSSGQWPLLTIKEEELSSRYPSDLMGTLSDILKFWISRMMMFSLYLTDRVPFKNVYLWSMVADSKGVKMSKSKGNVVNPVDLIDKYGADALRISVLYGTPAGSKVILSDDKVRAMRNFSNKLWNIARYIQMVFENTNISFDRPKKLNIEDEKLLEELNALIKTTTSSLESYKLNTAIEDLYEFTWHNFADKYIEVSKEKARNKDVSTLYTLRHTFLILLKLLHPFAPFVTEAIWQALGSVRKYPDKALISSPWPEHT